MMNYKNHTDMDNNNPIILNQRVFANYRLSIWEEIACRTGHEIQVFAAGNLSSHSKTVQSSTVHKNVILNPLRAVQLLQSGSQRVVWFSGYRKMVKKLRPFAFIAIDDITVLNNIWAIRYAEKNNIPYYLWSLGRIFSNNPSPWRKRIKIYHKSFMHRSSGIFCYSSMAKEYYIEEYKMPLEKCFVLYNCLDEKEVKPKYNNCIGQREILRKDLNIPEDGITFLFVGALLPSKRSLVLIDACMELKRRNYNVHLIIVGGGPEAETIEARSKDLPWIHFIGPCFDMVEKYFAASDVFVQPGLGGLGVHHAMICEMPVVAADGDGTEYDFIEDGKNGFLPPNRCSGLIMADHLESFFQNPHLIKSMGQHSWKLVQEKFNASLLADRIAKAMKL